MPCRRGKTTVILLATSCALSLGLIPGTERFNFLVTGEPHIDWLRAIPNNGTIRYLGPFNRGRFFLTTPETLADVLVNRAYDWEKPKHFRTNLGRILGFGLYFAEGDVHRIQRKALTPVFKSRHIRDDLYPIFWAKACECVAELIKHISTRHKDDWGPKASGKGNPVSGTVEVSGWASRATLDIIGVAGLGHDFQALKSPEGELIQAYSKIFAPSSHSWTLFILGMIFPPWVVSLVPLKANRDIKAGVKSVRNVCRQLIKEASAGDARKADGGWIYCLSLSSQMHFYHDTEALVDQLMTFLIAGHETTAAAMTWVIYLLAVYPDIQETLRQEVRENLPSPAWGQGITKHNIDRLPYLTTVCLEVLWCFPPLPLTARVAIRDTRIGDVHIPAGSEVFLVPWAINKSERLWSKDALHFNPRWWLKTVPARSPIEDGGDRETENIKPFGVAVSKLAFLTFLHGPRGCIGQNFAKEEFTCLLAAWVGRFKMELHDPELAVYKNVKIGGGITARPNKGMYINMTVLDGW